MIWYIILCSMLFTLGLALGKCLGDKLWREKAKSGFRMASGGKLYFVIEEHPMPKLQAKAEVFDAWD